MSIHILAVHLCLWNYVVHTRGTRLAAYMCINVCTTICVYVEWA